MKVLKNYSRCCRIKKKYYICSQKIINFMKTKLILLFTVGFILLSCKDGAKVSDKDGTETVAKTEKSFQLSSYSDDNWSNGVSTGYNMLLTDFSKEKEEILENGKELELKDGTIVPFTGYEVKGEFINIMLTESPSQYKEVVQYPNKIIVR